MNDKPVLTMEMLKQAKHRDILLHGTTTDSRDGLHIWGSGEPLVWVVTRGGIPDWAMYYAKLGTPLDEVARHGDKAFDQDAFRLLDCGPEVVGWYRR